MLRVRETTTGSTRQAAVLVGGAADQLAYQQTIPRHLVHRAAMAEVFITDGLRVDQDRFLVGAQWPREHALYHRDSEGRIDPLLLAETVRQAMLYLSHDFQGIPLTHRFIGSGLGFEITDPELLRCGATPVQPVLEVTWKWLANRPPQRYGMRLDYTVFIDGRPCATAWIEIVAVDDKRYGLLRGRGANAAADRAVRQPDTQWRALPALLVGRLRAKDSVLEQREQGGECRLRLDLDHPILFDHPSDHIPLMVMLEGFRQISHLLTHRGTIPFSQLAGGRHQLLAATIDCRAFGELDLPVRLVVAEDRETGGTRHLEINAVQGDVVIGSSTLLCEAMPTAGPTVLPAHGTQLSA